MIIEYTPDNAWVRIRKDPTHVTERGYFVIYDKENEIEIIKKKNFEDTYPQKLYQY